MSSSSSVVTAAYLNNRGVYCFLHHSSDRSSSLRFFRQALESVAASIHQQQEDEEEQCEEGAANNNGAWEEPEELVPRIVVGIGSADDASATGIGPLPTTTSTTPATTSKRGGSEPAGDEDLNDVVDRRGVVEPRSSALVPRDDDGMGAALAAGPLEVELVEHGTLSYARPINLIPSEGAYDVDPLVNASLMSSIVLFNMALVFHAMAHNHQQRGQDYDESIGTTKVLNDPAIRHVVQARDLYRKSLRLLRHEEEDDEGNDSDTMMMDDDEEIDGRDEGPERIVRRHHHPVLDVLHMALHNNLAATAYALGDYVECQAHLHDLVTACAHVVQGRDVPRQRATTDNDNNNNDDPHVDADTRAILEWHANVFLCNAHFLRNPPHGAAAA